MRKDTSFSDHKLTPGEFSRKYWMNGTAPYQYHTVNIEDGRDEREQLTINNIRALWDKITLYRKLAFSAKNPQIITTILAVTSLIVSVVTCVVILTHL